MNPRIGRPRDPLDDYGLTVHRDSTTRLVLVGEVCAARSKHSPGELDVDEHHSRLQLACERTASAPFDGAAHDFVAPAVSEGRAARLNQTGVVIPTMRRAAQLLIFHGPFPPPSLATSARRTHCC